MEVFKYKINNNSTELFEEVLETFPTEPLETKLTFKPLYKRSVQSPETIVQEVYSFNIYTKDFSFKEIDIRGKPISGKIKPDEIFLDAPYDSCLMKLLRTEFLPQMKKRNYVIKQGELLLNFNPQNPFVSGVRFSEEGLEVIFRASKDLSTVIVHEWEVKYWFDKLKEKYS